MDHLHIMGFLMLLFTTLSAVQFAEARILEHHLPNVAHNSAVTFDSDLDAVPVASSRQNYSRPGGHVANYSESNPGISSENLTHAANNTIITIELLQKEATPGDGSSSKAPAGIEEAAPIDGNADSLHEMLSSHSSLGIAHISLNDRSEGNILSSGQSPGVGHWEKSKNKYSTSPTRTTPNNVLSSGPSPGVGNGHISAIAGTQSELGTLNKLPSGPSPGVGHKVTNGYTEMVQESESKKSAMIMNILPSGPSPGVGNSATNGRNTMEKISVESEPKKKTAFNQDFESKKESAVIMNVLPSGPSPGVGNSATNGRNIMEKISIESESKKKTAFTHKPESKRKSAAGLMNILPSGPSPGVGNSASNGRNTMEKISKEEDGGMGIKTFNKLPSGPSPGVGHAYIYAHQPEKLERSLEDRKGSDIPIFHKLPGGPSPGGGHSYVEKSASTVRMQLYSDTLRKTSSGSGPGDDKSSISQFRPARGLQKKKVERTGRAVDGEIGCDGGGLDFYGTPTPPMFGIAAGRS